MALTELKQLIHNGILIPDAYLPQGFTIKFRGQPLKLSPLQEEMAVRFAQKFGTPYFEDKALRSNFIEAFAKALGLKEKITVEDFPRISMTRMVERDGAKYFGPYVHAKATRQTLKEITKAFPIRTCDLAIEEGKTGHRPCLDLHMGRCLGPCAGLVSKDEYQEVAKNISFFLKGNGKVILKELTEKMKESTIILNK